MALFVIFIYNQLRSDPQGRSIEQIEKEAIII
jgi:hypothetical protein